MLLIQKFSFEKVMGGRLRGGYWLTKLILLWYLFWTPRELSLPTNPYGIMLMLPRTWARFHCFLAECWGWTGYWVCPCCWGYRSRL